MGFENTLGLEMATKRRKEHSTNCTPVTRMKKRCVDFHEILSRNSPILQRNFKRVKAELQESLELNEALGTVQFPFFDVGWDDATNSSYANGGAIQATTVLETRDYGLSTEGANKSEGKVIRTRYHCMLISMMQIRVRRMRRRSRILAPQ